MVQILPNRQKSFADSLLGGAAEGASFAGQVMPHLQKQQQLQQEKQKKLEEEKKVNSYLKQLGVENPEGLPSDYKKSIFLDQLRQNNKKTTPAKPIAYNDIANVFRSTGYDARDMEDVGHKGMDEIRELATQYENEGLDRQSAISKAIKQQRNPQKSVSNALYNNPEKQAEDDQKFAQEIMNAPPEIQEGILEAGAKGVQASVFGRITAMMNGVSYDDYQKQVELNNPSTLNKFVKEIGRFFIGNGALVAAGGSVGAQGGGAAGSVAGPFGIAAGALLGGGAGALALPAALDTALEEYHKYKSNGGQKPFDAFLDGLAKTSEASLQSGIQGATLSILGESLPLLKQIPQLAPLFEAPYVGKAIQKTAVGTAQAAGILGSETFAKRKIPTYEEVVDTFAQILGFNMLGGLPEKARETVMNRVKQSSLTPDQIATQLKERVGDKQVDAKTIVREIVDITKSHQGPEKQAAESIIKTLGDVKIPEPKEKAKQLAERDIPEALAYEKRVEESKNRLPTEKEATKRKDAKEMADELLVQKKDVESDIEYLQENVNKGTQDNRKVATAALKAKQSELDTLAKEEARLRSIAEKGVEPFSEEALKKPIEKHMDELDKAAADPEGTTAQEWKQMFARDQKHVEDFAKILEKGELPPTKSKDRYIKTLEVYQKAYDSMIDQLHKGIKQRQETYDNLNRRTKQAKALKNEIDHLQRKLDILAQNRKINESKIGKQKDKLSTLYELNKPGSALTKQILKNMRKDIVDLQKEFIKHKAELDAFEKKTEKVAKNKIKETSKLLKEYQETGNKTLLEKVAEENNIPIEQMNKVVAQTEKEAKAIAEHVAKGAARDKAVGMFDKAIESAKERLKNAPSNIAYVILGTWLQDVIEDQTGFKPPLNMTTWLFPGSWEVKAGRSAIATLYKHIRKVINMSHLKDKYKTIKSLDDRMAFRRKLKKDYSKAEIDKITQG